MEFCKAGFVAAARVGRVNVPEGCAEMRSRQDERTLPVTARSLVTVIRLATAHAKAHQS